MEEKLVVILAITIEREREREKEKYLKLFFGDQKELLYSFTSYFVI